MYVGKEVERDAIHCSASPAYKQTRSCPGRVGVETVSPGVDRVGLLYSALLRYASPSHHGGEPCSGGTASQPCCLQADKMAMPFVETMAMSECVGVPCCVEGESERLGHVSDLKQGGKAKWVGRSVLKLNFELRLFPKMTLNVTLGKSSAHRYSDTVFCCPRSPRARGAPESAHHRLGLPTPKRALHGAGPGVMQQVKCSRVYA